MRLNKKVVLALAAVLALSLAVAGAVSAQGPIDTPNDAPWGRMARGLGPMRLHMGENERLVDVAARALGLEPEDLLARLQDGASLRQVIEEEGGNVEALVEEYVSAREAVLATAVEQKLLTPEGTDAAIERLRERVAAHLEAARDGDCEFGPRGRRMHRGWLPALSND